MHLHFFIRGQKDCVEIMKNWINTRTVLHPYWKNEKDYKAGKKPDMVAMSHLLRYSVAGSYELIIPEGEADKWLNTLGFDSVHPNTIKLKTGMAFLRKAMGLKKAPKYSKKEQVMLPSEYVSHVSFIPIGVKYDVFRQMDDGFHEAV